MEAERERVTERDREGWRQKGERVTERDREGWRQKERG